MRQILCYLICLTTGWSAAAATIEGTVTGIADGEVKLTLTGDLLPNAADKVDFFFKIPGLDDEVSVGSGTVQSADGKTATVKFEKGTGKPQAGQLARIHSAAPRKAGAPPAPALNVQRGASPFISWLGLITDSVPVEMIRALQLRPRSGAQIIGIVPGSPAALAGLQKNDIISEIGGDIVRLGDIERLTRTRQPGTKLAFAVVRNLLVYAKEVTLAPPITDAEFAEKIRASAEAGDAAAQMVYGGRLMAGYGGSPANAAEGMKWLTRAAEQELRMAQRALAIIHYNDQNDPGALAKGIEWFRRAATRGDAISQTALAGYFYSQGDLQQAAHFARLAAEQGDRQGEFLFGRMLLAGEGVQANPGEGVKFLGLAASQGLPAAMTLLGAMYEKGDGVTKDPAAALGWYQKAAAQGGAAAVPKDAPDVGKVATQSPASGQPPPENKLVNIPVSGAMPAAPPPEKPAAAIVPMNNPGAFAGTFKGDVTLVSGSVNGANVANGGPCPASFTIRLHPTGTYWGLDISSDRSKLNASQLDGHWNLKANGNSLSSSYSLPAGSETISIEVLGNEIKGTISSQSKVDGAVTRSSSYTFRASRVQP
ncbi:MAG: PDZ domain-containing protein [Verrucomicrobia bacterium]|nr:PDZ domain-containing protein [Verrucomicrobiota bacterium]